MRNKLTILLMLSALTFFFYACSDDSSTNPGNNDNPDEYYMLSVGNWWYYQTDAIDTLDGIIEGSTTFDTTKVVGKLEYKGKNAFRMISVYNQDNENFADTTYMAVEGSKLYTYMDVLGNSQFQIPYGTWGLIADFNQNEWTILDTTLTNIVVDISDKQTGTLDSVKIKITGKKLGKENITIKGQTVEAQKFSQTVSFKGELDLGGGFKINLDNEVNITFYFGKNVGLAKTYQPASIFPIPGFGNQQIQGSNTILLDYQVQ